MRHKVGPKPHDNPAAFANVSPDDMQKVVEKYVAWGNRLREAGVMKAGDKLADSYDEAIDHARDCPHLDYGGTIEVRQVDVM